MKPTHASDSWMNERNRATEWGSTLKPQRSSNRVLIVVTLIVMALLAFFFLRGAQEVESKPRPSERPIAPPEASSPPRLKQPRLEVKPEPPQRSIQRVAKCLSPSGAVSYSDGPCPAGTSAGAVDLRPDSNLADGMSDRARSVSLRQNAAAAQATAIHERRVALNTDQVGTGCAQLDALIASIDSAARLPQPGLEQDRLREQRKQARDKQFALRCP